MSYHEHHHFEIEKILHDKMSKIYIFQALVTFAKSLIGVFVPIYLFKSGYSIAEIMTYIIGISMFYLILIPVAVKILKQIGFKLTLLISMPIYVSHIILLNYITQNSIYFHLSWMTFGIYVSLFWPTFHSEIALSGSAKKRGSQLGTLQIITTIVGTLAPIIGGIVLEVSSYFYLLIISSIMIFLGIIPLLYSKDIRLRHYDFHYKDYLKLLRLTNREHSKRAFAAEGFNSVLILTIWPIIIFRFLQESYFNFGSLLTLASFISILFILYMKPYFDKRNKKELLKRVSHFVSINWLFKGLIIFSGMIFLYIIETLSKLVWHIFQILFSSIFYNNAKKTGYMDYIILREFYLHISKIILATAIIIISIMVGEDIIVLNSIALIGILVSIRMGLLKEEI